MGFRFRKSVKAGPFRVTFSKSGIGYSVGGKGFRVTKKAGGGVRTTASIPGTGISYVSDSGKGRKSSPASVQNASAERAIVQVNPKVDFCLCLFLGWLGVHKFYEKQFGMGVLYMFTCGLFCIGWIIDIIKTGCRLLSHLLNSNKQ